jgi:hypothetical protein
MGNEAKLSLKALEAAREAVELVPIPAWRTGPLVLAPFPELALPRPKPKRERFLVAEVAEQLGVRLPAGVVSERMQMAPVYIESRFTPARWHGQSDFSPVRGHWFKLQAEMPVNVRHPDWPDPREVFLHELAHGLVVEIYGPDAADASRGWVDDHGPMFADAYQRLGAAEYFTPGWWYAYTTPWWVSPQGQPWEVARVHLGEMVGRVGEILAERGRLEWML